MINFPLAADTYITLTSDVDETTRVEITLDATGLVLELQNIGYGPSWDVTENCIIMGKVACQDLVTVLQHYINTGTLLPEPEA